MATIQDENRNSTPTSAGEVKEAMTVSHDVGAGEEATAEDGPLPHIHLKTYLAVFAVGLIYFVQNFAIVGAGAQGQIIAGIFNRTSDAAWIAATLAIFTVVLGPIVSQASDYWGRKWFLVILSFFGGVGSIIVSRSTDMTMVIAGFCVVGLAFGAQPLVHAVSSEVLPRRWRPWGQACAMISTGLGLVAGLLVAGAVNRTGDANGFRNFYYITAGLFFLATAICVFVYNPPPTPLQLEYTVQEKLARLDWVGYGLLASSLVLFCIALSWSLNPYEWSDPHVSATFAVSIVLCIALAVYEWRFRKDGLFHHGLFKGNRMFAICLFCVFSEGVAFFAATTYFPFSVNVLYEKDFLFVTTRFAVGFMATIVASLTTGLYCAKTKKVRWATFVAFVIFVAFFAGMATTNKSTSMAAWGLPVLMGWGLGMTLVALITAAQLCVPHELIGVASGLLISVRSLGGTVGIAIYQAVFSTAMSHLGENVAHAAVAAGLPPSSVPDFITNLAGQNETGLILVHGVTPEIIGAGAGALLDTYASGFRNVWISAAAFVSIAAIASLFMFDPSKEFNHRIDAPIEKEEDLYSA